MASTAKLTTDEEVDAFLASVAQARTEDGDEIDQRIDGTFRGIYVRGEEEKKDAVLLLLERLRGAPLAFRLRPTYIAIDRMLVAPGNQDAWILVSLRLLLDRLSPRAVHVVILRTYAYYAWAIQAHHSPSLDRVEHSLPQLMVELVLRCHEPIDDLLHRSLDATLRNNSLFDAVQFGSSVAFYRPMELGLSALARFRMLWDRAVRAAGEKRDAANAYQLTAPHRHRFLTASDRVHRNLRTHERIGLGKDLDRLAASYLDAFIPIKDGSSSSSSNDSMRDD